MNLGMLGCMEKCAGEKQLAKRHREGAPGLMVGGRAPIGKKGA